MTIDDMAGAKSASDANAKPIKGPDEKFCFECGEIIRAKAEICPKCGVRQPTPLLGGLTGLPVTPSGKNKLAAALFAFFLGWCGIHKFYLGQTTWGIVYALFFWTAIPAVAGLVEGIIYLTMTEEAFAAKYG